MQANRPDGEGYAGVGELVVRIRVAEGGLGGLVGGGAGGSGSSGESGKQSGQDKAKKDRASVEIRYLGLDTLGRAVFERHDVDELAGAPVAPRLRMEAGAEVKPDDGKAAEARSHGAADANVADLQINTRQIVIDMRLARQIRVQGKTIDVIEATSSGVVFHLY